MCLIEQDDFLDRRLVASQIFVTKVMDVLDECRRLAQRRLFVQPFRSLGGFGSFYLISRKRLSQHGDKRPIARQKNCVLVLVSLNLLASDIESRKGFAGAGDSGDEAY